VIDMLLDLKTISTLRKMGLTLYGAKVYTALVSIGPANATVLAKEADVPRTKIYEVLRRLEEDRWVVVENGRPNLYSPRYPREIIDEKRSSLFSEIDDISHELTMTYDHLMEKENPKVWLIRGTDNIAAKAIEMISRARQSVMMLGTLYSPVEIEQLTDEIARVKKKGVSVRIITRPKLRLRNGEIDIVAALRPVTADIRIAGPPFLKYTMIDERELLMTFARVEDNKPDPESFIAIWIPSTSVTQYNVSNFNTIWNTAEPVP
jgi:sugar-specific transcriptional regulator TrmB